MLARVVLCVVMLVVAALPADAQNWSFDARRIGMGSPGGADNLAMAMIDEERDYRAIVLPFGLIQVLSDIDRLNPTKDEFDLVRTIEYAAAPLHYTFGRDTTGSGREFVVDIRNAELSRDLNRYRGFVPANQPPAEGLASPRWGGTIRVHEDGTGGFHGVYLGAGPYVGMRTSVLISEQLLDVLDSPVDVYVPHAAFPIANAATAQLAGALTGGYRARLGLFPTAAARDGLYVAANVNYLRGFRYEDTETLLRLDTDDAGLLTVNPAAGDPLAIRRDTSTSGSGMSIDVGLGAVVGNWEAGIGATGLANRIEWRDVERRTYALASLFTGDADFAESDPVGLGSRRVVLPVDVQATLAYQAPAWTAAGEVGRGFQGTSFRAGFEQRFAMVAVRGGASYSREKWSPAAGVGVDLTEGLGLDAAVYGNTANVERKRLPALAVSLRLNR